MVLHVNIGAARLGSLEFEREVQRTLDRCGLTPSQLVLEITETVPVVDLADAAAQITRLNAIGIKVALDDFGAGYSSLTYLHALPVQIIKLDRGLAVGPEPARIETLYRSVIRLCDSLGVDVIAEGIESDGAGRHGLLGGMQARAGSPVRACRANRGSRVDAGGTVGPVNSPSRPLTRLDKSDVLSGLFGSWDAIDGVVGDLSDSEWEQSTSLPGWTVHDVVAHVVGTESMLQGLGTPEADIDVSALEHVRNDIGVLNECWVRKLRGLSHAELLEHFRATAAAAPGGADGDGGGPVARNDRDARGARQLRPVHAGADLRLLDA